jgi:3-dehydroquinate dehydratase-1
MIGERILIAAVLAGEKEKILSMAEKAKADGADILELRFDRIDIKDREASDLARLIKEEIHLPIIGTKRPREKEERGRFFEGVIPFVDAVDLEEEEDVADILKMTKLSRKKVILSHHNYKETPDMDGLKRLLSSMLEKGADIVKLATFVEKREEIVRLLLLTAEWRETPIITIGMGKAGSITRIVAPLFGSCITYGYIDRPQAPGQLSVKTLRKELLKFGIA